ncbi:MAG TPA: hypothetical protein VFA81_01110 [Burkholderiales bacterium]|nr:hypothetical protein [Burkholderiales bacterium]
MTPELHRTKAERISRSLAKCTAADYEAVIEGVMLAGSHWLNYAAHIHELRPPEQDIMHAEFLTKVERLKLSLVMMDTIEALEEIEASRALYVRGSAPGGEQMGARALELLERIRSAALAARPLRPGV